MPLTEQEELELLELEREQALLGSSVGKVINPSGKTFSPQDFLQQELASVSNENRPIKPGFDLGQYFSLAQPAFKLALSQPQTLAGQAISPEQLQKATSSEYADIYRQAGLPGSQSTNMAGQMIPQAAGLALDIASRPSSLIGSAIASPIGNAMANNPTTRRFLMNQLPTLSKGIIEANPMAPIYKEVNKMMVDITKPLPKAQTKLVKTGQKLVDSIQSTMTSLGKEYGKMYEPFYNTKVNTFAGIPNKELEAIGIDPTKSTVKDLWEARFDLLRQVGNPWKKDELLKKTTLNEEKLRNIITKLKAATLNAIPKEARDQISIMDTQYGQAVSAGKGLLRVAHDPETKRINTTRLYNIFKNKEDEGSRELFDRFSYFDKNISEISNKMKRYVFQQKLKEGVAAAAPYVAIGGLGFGAALAGKKAIE